MENKYKLKNIELSKILRLEDEISYQKGQIVSKGETLIMPNQVPHAVYGEEQFKMLLTVVF